MYSVEEVTRQLMHVYDPELGVNIVDLGLVYKVECSESGDVNIEMTLTTPGCPLHDSIVGGVKTLLTSIPGIRHVEVKVVWSPPWTPQRMSERAREQLGQRR